MNSPVIFHASAKSATGIWNAPVFRPALIAAAAIAGYVIVMPFAPKTAIDPGVAEEPQWAGHIASPDVQTPAQSEPITSASYVTPEAISAGNAAKTGAAVAVIPKVASKSVTPPRKSQSLEEASKPAPSAPAMIASATAIPAEAIPPGAIPPEAIPPQTQVTPRQRNLFSPVTDRLPSRGTLLKPFHVVGDAFHNLLESVRESYI